MPKIKMTTPIVEMDGDEMTRILWKMIKEDLLEPYIELNTEYYDLGLEHRNETNDQVTVDAANATKKYKVAVKCATITPNAARMTEYDLKEMWKSPNGTIRAILDGTVFRAPIVVKGIEPCVKNWKKPITIARHAYGDVYKNTEMKIPGPGKVELVYTAEDGTETRELVHNYAGPGVAQGMHNLCGSIESFARSCFNYALDTKQDLWFATKDTISKKYDHTFKDIFQEIFDKDYADKFKEAGITYFYTLIDDAYNASPDSMKASLSILSEFKTRGRKIAVLSDMLELGPDSPEYHKEVGRFIATTKVTDLFITGELSRHYIEEAWKENPSLHTRAFSSNGELIAFLETYLKKNDVVLIKGSNGMNLKEVSKALMA